jgi:glucose-6-phosphate isomerase
MSLNFNYSTNADLKHSKFSDESLNLIHDKFIKTIDDKANGFFHLTDRKELIEQAQTLHIKHQNKKHFVQIGIGGSALGPQMLVSALRKNWDMSFTVLDNPDSDFIFNELQKIDIKDSLFYIVSKSGGTAETIACYSLIRNLLSEAKIPTDQFKDYFVFCTDLADGQLRKHVDANNYDSLEVPSNVGGRFSVLTHVGLFPALFMGIDIEQLFSGANELKTQLLSKDFTQNSLMNCAAHLTYLLFDQTPTVNETVMMPYSSKLKDFSFWFVQLWAESLGKFSTELNTNTGLTPIPGYGATDQHSQMQLFMEGPKNKCMFLINIKNREHNFTLDSDLELESAHKLKKITMNELIEAEYKGTQKALKENDRDFISIEIDALNESNIGQLVLFFECLTTVVGEYLSVNPFNQPGVEKGKIYAFEYLNSLSK